MSPDAAPPSKELPLWRRVMPFVVGGALVAFVATRLDYGAFMRAMRDINAVGYIAFAFAFCVGLLVADVFATMIVYRRTIAPVGYRELFVIRAASYLPSLLNFHVGQAWLTYFLAKVYKVPLARTAGSTLLVYATTFGGLFVFLLVAVPFNHGRVTWLVPAVAIIGAAAVAYAIVLVVKPRFATRLSVAAPLFDSGLSGHLEALAARLPHILCQFLGAWVPFLFFGVDVPFGDALVLIPILMLVVTLPVSPQGMGTRDAVALALVSSYARGTPAERASAVAASTVSWLVVTTVFQAAIGAIFAKPARDLMSKAAASPETA